MSDGSDDEPPGMASAAVCIRICRRRMIAGVAPGKAKSWLSSTAVGPNHQMAPLQRLHGTRGWVLVPEKTP